jgi:hypothetical protein
MADQISPYIIAAITLLAGIVGWLFKQQIQAGKDIVAIQTALKYYFQEKGKAATVVLDTPNPTPAEIRQLFRDFRYGELTEEGRDKLIQYLLSIPKTDKEKFSEARDFAATLGAMRILNV